MKDSGRFLYRLTVIVGLTAFLSAQSAFALGALATATKRIEKPYFYEISSNGKKSYILGTFHVGITPQELPEIVMAKLNSAKVLWVEKKLNQQLVESTLENSLDFFVKLKNLRNERQGLDRSPLSRTDKQKLKEFFHLPAEVINVMRCDDVISFFFMNGSYTFPKIKSLDYSILNEARLKKIPTYELDTDELRRVALEISLSSPENKKKLEEASKNLPSTGCDLKDQLQSPQVFEQAQENEKLLLDYKAGKLLSDDDEFVTYRNLAWIENENFLTDLSNGDAYVAVGAYHLLGEKGILTLLKAKGFQVKWLP